MRFLAILALALSLVGCNGDRMKDSNLQSPSTAALASGQLIDADHQGRQSLYSSSWPKSLPVFRLRKCNLVQAGQVIPSYSFSPTSS
jgi:hypothetical protein